MRRAAVLFLVGKKLRSNLLDDRGGVGCQRNGSVSNAEHVEVFSAMLNDPLSSVRIGELLEREGRMTDVPIPLTNKLGRDAHVRGRVCAKAGVWCEPAKGEGRGGGGGSLNSKAWQLDVGEGKDKEKLRHNDHYFIVVSYKVCTLRNLPHHWPSKYPWLEQAACLSKAF